MSAEVHVDSWPFLSSCFPASLASSLPSSLSPPLPPALPHSLPSSLPCLLPPPNRISAERDGLREKVTALEASCDNLRQSIRDVREQTLVDAQKEGQERVKSAQHQLRLARDEVASLQDELAERVEHSREAGEREQQAMYKLNAQVEAQSSRIIRMDAILQAADREVRSLFSALRIEEGDIVDVRASPGGISASVQSLAGRIATATSTVADKAARDGSSRAMLKLKEEELANLRHKRESENKAFVSRFVI